MYATRSNQQSARNPNIMNDTSGTLPLLRQIGFSLISELGNVLGLRFKDF